MPDNTTPTQPMVQAYAQLINQVGFPIVMASVLLYIMLKFIPAIEHLTSAIDQWHADTVAQHQQIITLVQQIETDQTSRKP